MGKKQNVVQETEAEALSDAISDHGDHGGTPHDDDTDTVMDEAAAAKSIKPAATVVRKLTVATVYGVIDVAALPKVGEKIIGKIGGVITGLKKGVSQYGPWTAFVGDFAGVNLDSGEIFQAAACLIPGAMGEALVNAAEHMLSADSSAKMKFAVVISLKRSPRAPDEKYEYVVRPLIEGPYRSPALALLGFE